MSNRTARFLAFVVAILAFSLLSGCVPPPKPCPPNCPPPPSPTPSPMRYHAEMLLHAEGMSLKDTTGKTVLPVIPVSDVLNFSWALASRQHWQDPLTPHLKPGPGTAVFVIRNGPAGTDPAKPYFTDQIGAPYLRMPDGRYDLNQWNPVYWKELNDEISYGGDQGYYFELDGVGGGDGWVGKVCKAHPERVPDWFCIWAPQNNVQQQNWYATIGTLPLGYVPTLFVRKYVAETCHHGNVTYETSNERNLLPTMRPGAFPAFPRPRPPVRGYSDAKGMHIIWDAPLPARDTFFYHSGDAIPLPRFDPNEEIAWLAIIRDEETKNGCPHHLIGTNSGNQTVIAHPEIGYSEWHQNLPVDPAWCAGKPCGVNEYGGQDATPQQFADRFCQAQRQGTWYCLWAEDMTQPAFNEALDLVKGGCASACVHPPPLLLPPLPGRDFQTGYLDALENLKKNRNDLFSAPYGTPGDDIIKGWTATPPDMTPGSPRYQLFMSVTDALSLEACKLGYQAGAEGDEDSVMSKDGFCEYRHHILFGPGKLAYDGSWGPDGFYKGRFACR